VSTVALSADCEGVGIHPRERSVEDGVLSLLDRSGCEVDGIDCVALGVVGLALGLGSGCARRAQVAGRERGTKAAFDGTGLATVYASEVLGC
jgi:hypothetical protein